jgi:hypothetical protein
MWLAITFAWLTITLTWLIITFLWQELGNIKDYNFFVADLKKQEGRTL